jgi:3-keto-disaccharide hydrolase
MMHVMSILSLLIGMLACALPAGIAMAADSITPTDSVIKLFNGKDLNGLTTWLADTTYADPRKVFSVADGMLHISGDGLGCIRTNDSYRDYHLVLEYRWGPRTWGERKEKARDSGILIHAVGADGSAHKAWLPSIEALIIEGGTGGFIVVAGSDADGHPVKPSLSAEVRDGGGPYPVWKRGGTKLPIPPGHVDWSGKDPKWQDRLGFRGPSDVENPMPEWNRMEVIAPGDRITIRLNGITVNEALDCFPKEGKIAIQCELAEIDVRRWELRPLRTNAN